MRYARFLLHRFRVFVLFCLSFSWLNRAHGFAQYISDNWTYVKWHACLDNQFDFTRVYFIAFFRAILDRLAFYLFIYLFTSVRNLLSTRLCYVCNNKFMPFELFIELRLLRCNAAHVTIWNMKYSAWFRFNIFCFIFSKPKKFPNEFVAITPELHLK